MNTPNLFLCGTTELSQDAFLVWLMKWADAENRTINPKLHSLGYQFIKFMLQQPGCSNELIIESVIAGRKDLLKNVDCWAVVNNKYLIVIEDKTNTGEHSDQLRRYADEANKLAAENNIEKVVLIYIKTGNDCLSAYKTVTDKGYSVITRKDLLDFFSGNSFEECNNDILTDFVLYLKSIEDETAAFKEMSIGKWRDPQWQGLYMAIESGRDDLDWHDTPNQNGGFCGMNFKPIGLGQYNVYMQIEGGNGNGNLCYKIEVFDKANQLSARTQAHSIIMDKAKELGLTEIRKPKRFGKGETMTVAIVPKEEWLGKDEDIIDMDKVRNNISKYESILKNPGSI